MGVSICCFENIFCPKEKRKANLGVVEYIGGPLGVTMINGPGEEIGHTVLADAASRSSSADSMAREGWNGSL